MKRIRRTDEELKRASDHLFYEVWMFNSLARGMASGVFGQGVINNAVLESFTIHARAILDFLYSTNPRADDVIAEDFFATPDEWHKQRPKKSDILQKIHQRVGKEVAHLTYVRQDVTPEAKEWNFVQISTEINVVISSFVEIVAKKLLSQSWSNVIVQPNDDKLAKVYFIYENWVAKGHKAKIHFGHCSFCKFGRGIHGSENKENGRWLGPFVTLSNALVAAKATGGRVSKCKHCNPN